MDIEPLKDLDLRSKICRSSPYEIGVSQVADLAISVKTWMIDIENKLN